MNASPTLRPMTDAEFTAWAEQTVPAYARDKVESGAWAEDDALERSRGELVALLPQGRRTPDNFLFTVLADDGTPVGMLWFAVQARAKSRIAYVYNVEIAAAHRRQGHAQRAFKALEQEVQRLGLAGIALHVFGHNHSAQALYAGLGFVPTNISLFKAVPAAE